MTPNTESEPHTETGNLNFRLRFLATIIDIFIVMGIAFLIGIGLVSGGKDPFSEIIIEGLLSEKTFIIFIVAGFFYYPVFESVGKQATIGTRVINSEETKLITEKTTFSKVAGRYIIDTLILIGVTFSIIIVLVLIKEGESQMENMVMETAVSFSLSLSVIIGLFYFSILECSIIQSTLGKRVFGLEVTDLAGERVSFVKAIVRQFAKIISVVIFLIGFLMVLWDEKKQGLHDKLAKTLVIRR